MKKNVENIDVEKIEQIERGKRIRDIREKKLVFQGNFQDQQNQEKEIQYIKV